MPSRENVDRVGGQATAFSIALLIGALSLAFRDSLVSFVVGWSFAFVLLSALNAWSLTRQEEHVKTEGRLDTQISGAPEDLFRSLASQMLESDRSMPNSMQGEPRERGTMNYPEELFKRISTRGEVGIAAIGFVLAYLLDLKMAFFGLAPGMAGLLGAVTGVGTKNAVQSVWDSIALLCAAHFSLESSVRAIETLANKVAASAPPMSRLAQGVRSDFDLWRKGLLSEASVRQSIDEFVQSYRAFKGHAAPRAASALVHGGRHEADD